MKEATIKRIIKAAYYYEDVIIGAYTYRADLQTGDILRCKTSDIGTVWITPEGKRITGWKVVAHA